MPDHYDDEYQRITNIVSTLRKNETEITGLMKDLVDGISTKDPDRPTKGRVIYADFDIDDAKRLVKEIASDTGRSTKEIAENLYSGLEYDEKENTVNLKFVDPDKAFDKFLADPNSLEGVLANKEEQLWNDPKYVLKGEFFALSLKTAADEKFGLMDANLARQIKAFAANEITEEQFDAIPEETMNWLSGWENNYPLIQEYLSTGRVRDEVGELTITVPGWTQKSVEDSMEALLSYDVDHPSRINSGRAYLPQYGDTFTDRRKKIIAEKFDEWGWNRGQTVKENVERIFKQAGYEPGNKATFKDADMRHSLGYIMRENIIKPLEERLMQSINEPGSPEYGNDAIELLLGLAGSELETYLNDVGGYYSEIATIEWDTKGREGQDKAVDKVLDLYGYKRSEFEDDQIASLRESIEGHDTLGAAMEDVGMGANIDAFYSMNLMASEEETLAKEATAREKFNLSGNLTKLVKDAFRKEGFLGLTSSIGYENYLDSTTIPDIVRRITNTGGVDDPEQLNELVADLTKQENLGTPQGLPAYMVNEEDYTRQLGPNWDKRHLFKEHPELTGDPPSVPGLEISRYRKAPAPAFELDSIQSQLQDMAYDDPGFAKFIQQEMSLPGFAKDWEREGAEQYDQQAFSSAVQGEVGQEAYEQQARRLRELEASYGARLAGELTDEERTRVEGQLATARQRYADEIGAGSGQSPEERKRLEDLGVEFTPSLREQAAKQTFEKGLIEAEREKQAALRAEATQMAQDLAIAQDATVELYPEEAGGAGQTVARYSEAELAQMQKEMEAKVQAAGALDVGIAGMEKLLDPAPIGITDEGERKEMPGLRADKQFLTTMEFRDEQRRRLTSPGMTSAEFFESRLPGFEERYKKTPFFRLEQDRKQRLAEQEEEQRQKEYETQRRRRLRAGSGGGRGRTIVTRGRR